MGADQGRRATTWVIIGCVILAGVGILTAVMQTRSKDRPNP